MKLALHLSYSGAELTMDVAKVREVERLGFDSIWTAEAYGSDAVTPTAWVAAVTERVHIGTGIMQIAARTPAMTAMTAMTLDAMSRGRFRLGLGVSGPQVVEGWHGQAFGKPLKRTREYVEIVRAAIRREKPLQYRGEYYQIPYGGEDATGLGKPLKSIIHGRPEMPIYLAAIGPKNVALAAEIADGWIPIFFSPQRMTMYREWLEEGFRKAGDKPRGFDIMPSVGLAIGDDVGACRATMKSRIALYVGGMGARGKNFYNELARRYGYDEAATKVQDLYLSGKKAEAEAAVPDALVDEVALCGPRERIREQLAAWKAAGVTTMMVSGAVPALRTLTEVV